MRWKGKNTYYHTVSIYKRKILQSICRQYAERKRNINFNAFNNRGNIKNMVAKRFQNER